VKRQFNGNITGGEFNVLRRDMKIVLNDVLPPRHRKETATIDH
jgi:hypothetical protein